MTSKIGMISSLISKKSSLLFTACYKTKFVVVSSLSSSLQVIGAADRAGLLKDAFSLSRSVIISTGAVMQIMLCTFIESAY